MKKCLIIFLALISVSYFSCTVEENNAIRSLTLEKESELIPPGEVSNITSVSSTNSISISWANPEDPDLYGISIIGNPMDGALSTGVSFVKGEGDMPTSATITGLTSGQNYSLRIRTFDRKLNLSTGVNYVTKTDANTGSNGAITYSTDEIIGYKKNLLALDFGYGKATKTVALTPSVNINIKSDIKIEGAGYKLDSVVPENGGTSSESVSAGERVSVTITHTPTSATAWDESTLKFGDTEIKLIGSGYKQPRDIKNGEHGVKLWLRADLISNENMDGTSVMTLPDYSGNHFDAVASGITYAPYYESSDSKFNNMPVVTWVGKTDAQLTSMGAITKNTSVTSFVVFHAESTLATYSIVSANSGTAFPVLAMYPRNIGDLATGYNTTASYGLGVRGNGMAGTYRFPFKKNEIVDNNTWIELNEITGRATSSCMVYDKDVSPFPSNGDYPSNMRMWVDGEERFLSYLHSNNGGSTTVPIYNNNFATYGAYNKPYGDRKGHRYLLDNCKVPGSSDKNNNNEAWQKWSAERENSKYKSDYSFSYSPLDVVKASSSASSTNGSYYFVNWLPTDRGRNGTINSITLGPDMNLSTVAYCKIAEVIIFDYKLSDAEINEVNKYIELRYGTTKRF